jgi:hypothetical protein
LAESRELLGLRLMKAREFARAGGLETPTVPAEASVLDVVQTLARRTEGQQLSPVVIGDEAGGPRWVLEPPDLVRAIIGAVAPPR